MATVTVVNVERSGPAIHAALAEHAPGEETRFVAEFRKALGRVADELDLAPVSAVLARWHALAAMAANPLTAEECAQLERARAGDFTGFYAHDEAGNWIQL